jgi:hypothetical protein
VYALPRELVYRTLAFEAFTEPLPINGRRIHIETDLIGLKHAVQMGSCRHAKVDMGESQAHSVEIAWACLRRQDKSAPMERMKKPLLVYIKCCVYY